MATIQINVTVNTVSITNIGTVNQGEYNVTDCEFTFSNQYEGLIKRAVFVNGLGRSYLTEIKANNKCSIPLEVLNLTGLVYLGVYGYRKEGQNLVLVYSPSPTTFNISTGSNKFNNYVSSIGAMDLIDRVNELVTDVQQKIDAGDFNGVGISSIVFNQDYTMTITLTNGDRVTSQSLRGAQGKQGEKGDSYVITQADYDAIAAIVLAQVNIPTKVSQLENDSHYVNETQLQEALADINQTIETLNSKSVIIAE